jgi:hypothetical protein
MFQLDEGVKDFCLEEDKAENVGLGNSMNVVQVPAHRQMYSAYSIANILEFWAENYCSVYRRNAPVGDETMQDWWVSLQYKLGADCQFT